MSIINRMLQDLAQQQQKKTTTPLPAQITAVPFTQAPSVPKWAWFVLAGLINLCALAAIAWWYSAHTRITVSQNITIPTKPKTVTRALAATQILPADTRTSDTRPPKASITPPKATAVAPPDRQIRTQDRPPAPLIVSSASLSAPQDSLVVGQPTRQAKTPTVSIQAEPPSPAQIADKLYNHALDQVQQGDTQAAISTLQNGLQSQPDNAKIRLALVSLLIKNNRNDEAEHSLQAGLALNPAYVDMAMLLARLQVAHNHLNEGIATLQRSLPFAGNQADFHAMLATLLQQTGDNAAAIEQYVIALRQSPQTGVWWMGLGIAEKASKHPDAAQEAFSKALATQSLSPELQAFVQQQL